MANILRSARVGDEFYTAIFQLNYDWDNNCFLIIEAVELCGVCVYSSSDILPEMETFDGYLLEWELRVRAAEYNLADSL